MRLDLTGPSLERRQWLVLQHARLAVTVGSTYCRMCGSHGDGSLGGIRLITIDHLESWVDCACAPGLAYRLAEWPLLCPDGGRLKQEGPCIRG
jgi:hypothetical protein